MSDPNTGKAAIEARLDRSLSSQVRVPKLDRHFDAAVWARIEAGEQPRTVVAPRAVAPLRGAQRWLLASNISGFVVAAILVMYFGARMLSGVEVNLPAVPMPSLSPEQADATLKLVGWGITLGAIAFGLIFTPLGRRLRSEFT
jgi:hypothetical protein